MPVRRKPAGRRKKPCITPGGDKTQMEITLDSRRYAEFETEALVSYVFEETDPVQGRIAELNQATGGLLQKLVKSGELTGKMLEMTLIQIGRASCRERV